MECVDSARREMAKVRSSVMTVRVERDVVDGRCGESTTAPAAVRFRESMRACV